MMAAGWGANLDQQEAPQDAAGVQPPPTDPPDPAVTAEPVPRTAVGESPLPAEAQSGTHPPSTTSGLIAVGLLIAVVMILGLVVLALRKKMFREEADDRSGSGLLDDLREAVREGRMTQEEFDAAKRVMVAKMTAAYKGEKADRPKG